MLFMAYLGPEEPRIGLRWFITFAMPRPYFFISLLVLPPARMFLTRPGP
jgi:hypothetical protein